MIKSHQTGLLGEQIAHEYLVANGYKILCERFRYGHAEIDLIAMHSHILCFIEVKYRPCARLGNAAEAVTPAKVARIKKAADAFQLAHKNQLRYVSVRFDILDISRAGVWHLKGICL